MDPGEEPEGDRVIICCQEEGMPSVDSIANDILTWSANLRTAGRRDNGGERRDGILWANNACCIYDSAVHCSRVLITAPALPNPQRSVVRDAPMILVVQPSPIAKSCIHEP